tara:strand:- start:70241 stop:70705 length:465 start_codon:yes stop_codon:yes gene_type:complete
MSNDKNGSLENILDTIQSKLKRLDSQLEAEKRLLEQHTLENIDTLLKEKHNEFEQLNTDIVLLQDFFNNKQLDFSSESINPYISSASQDVKDKWQLFINTLQSCQEKNLINGLLVMGMKNYNDKLLGLLTQQNPETYHPSQPVKKTMSTREHKA